MKDNEIIDFRKQVANLSLEDLKKEQINIQNEISQMILNSDAIIKAAIIETLIKEKEDGQTK